MSEKLVTKLVKEKGPMKMEIGNKYLIVLVFLIAGIIIAGCGKSPEVSPTGTAKKDIFAPSAVKNLTAIGLSGKAIVSWEANIESDFAYYKLYRAEEKIPGRSWSNPTYEFLTNVITNRYEDDSVVDGTKYYYKVSAVDTSSNESSVTIEVNATPVSYKYEKGWDAETSMDSLSLTHFNDLLLGVGKIDINRALVKSTAYLFGIESGELRASLEVGNGKCIVVDESNYLYSILMRGSETSYYAGETFNSIYKYHFQGVRVASWEVDMGGLDVLGAGNGILFHGGILYLKNLLVKSKIYYFSSSQRTITEWATISDKDKIELYGIASDSTGNYVYVTDRGNNRVLKFDKNGGLLTTWGESGKDGGRFDWPQGVAVDIYGSVYIADRMNFRIQKFGASGNFLTKWGGYGTSEVEFSPEWVVVDVIGRVYVADSNNEKIKVFYPTEGFKP